MASSIDEVEVTSEAIDRTAGFELLDRRARELLGVSAGDFLTAWDSGDLGRFDHVVAMELGMLIPLARKLPPAGV